MTVLSLIENSILFTVDSYTSCLGSQFEHHGRLLLQHSQTNNATDGKNNMLWKLVCNFPETFEYHMKKYRAFPLYKPTFLKDSQHG